MLKQTVFDLKVKLIWAKLRNSSPMNAKTIVGDNVRGYRKLRDLTQVQLSVGAGINSEHLSRIESGSENVTIETLEKIALELKVDLYKLFIPNSFAA